MRKAAVSTGASADHLVEQLPPTNTWGKKFILSSIPGIPEQEVYRFVASEDSTVVTVRRSDNTVHTLDIANAGEYEDLQPPNGFSATVVATKPILVVQFERCGPGTGYDGDPSMQIVPPINLYGSEFTFPFPDSRT